MSMTVTAAQGGATANGIGIDVRVVTGQAAAFAGASTTSLTADSKSITPQAAGSFIYGALCDFLTGAAAFTAASGTTFRMNVGDSTNFETLGGFRKTVATPNTTAVTVGSSSTGFGSGALAILEVKAASGLTLAEDASTPAVASTKTAHTITTVSFTPPGGALLVALVASDDSETSATTATVSDSSGLTWTKQLDVGGGGNGNALAQIWTAVVPGTGVTGTGTIAVPKPSLAGTGSVGVSGAGTIRVPKPALAGAGTFDSTVEGTGTIRVPKPALAGTGVVQVTGTGSIAVPKPQPAGTGWLTVTGTGTIRVPKPSLAGTGRSGSQSRAAGFLAFFS